MAVIGPNEADKDGMVPARLLADVRVSMEELLTQNVNAWGEVDRLHEQLRGAVEALRLIADPPMGNDYTAPREYAEWLRDQARRALANLGGQ
jgi:hypothetical protein